MILYSVGNEIHDTPKPDLAKPILRGLVDVCHEVNPTRPVTQALFRPNVSGDYKNGLADMLDVIGTNYRDQGLLEVWKDKKGRKIVGTEQGHERSTWLACRDNPQHAGQFLWCGIDYLGESRSWPLTVFNGGLLGRVGFIQPRGYERQGWWSEKPMIRMFRRIARSAETPADPGYEAMEWKSLGLTWDDVSHIEVRLVDEHGTVVPDASDPVKFEVSGPGKFIAVDSGSVVSTEPFQASERKAYQGRCLAIVRATGKGTFKLTAKSGDLEAASVEIAAE